MKFCKNLQRVADLSNPEWSPYWTDYKKLKKIIKRLSELDLEVPQTQGSEKSHPATPHDTGNRTVVDDSPSSTQSASPLLSSGKKQRKQGQGDRTAEASPASASTASPSSSTQPQIPASVQQHQQQHQEHGQAAVDTIRRNPGEIMFFKLLHGEVQKAQHFFDRVMDEFNIREERVVGGMQIVRRGNRFQLWSPLAKSVYRLYTDMLLLETFCIMTYCSFSKILKKHDKVTGFDTRNAFMSNVVNKANFTNYTNLQAMIRRCEQLYSEVSNRVVQEGQQSLYEDERLFIEMVHQLNQQV